MTLKCLKIFFAVQEVILIVDLRLSQKKRKEKKNKALMQLIISGIEHTEYNINILEDLVFPYIKYL